jgi:DNA invertase Pin-like site-specific DNA recombinase
MSETIIRETVPALSSKIRRCHLDRMALVYVRQSTLQQLEQHRESTRVQYGLADRACRMGWPQPRVNVIDDDLGCSGASFEGRPGFQRLVAEVGLGRVGLVLGFEVSRLARSCRDWYQLLEICALANTLIADSDGVYDPALYNDRLLLGLKGTMSEAELHIMRARLDAGRRHKAERGELGFNLPRGFIRTPSGDVVQDPDERVRETIRMVFDIFERRRSVHGVVRYLADHDISLPDRQRVGPDRGEVVWHKPDRSAVIGLLVNPAYAGTYAFGRRSSGTTLTGKPRGSSRQQPSRNAADWQVLLKDRWSGYITWTAYQENQTQLALNRSNHRGTPRGGPSLLAGLLVCGRCGHRMVTCYRNNGRDLRYECTHEMINRGAARCQTVSGRNLDALITDLVLQALRPGAVEISLQLAEDVELERTQHHRQWVMRLERARYEVERAERQYAAVEPENRLVARTLEQRWEAALTAEAALRDEQARFAARAPARLTPIEQEAIRRLAADVPALWQAATTTAAERKEIVRLLLERVEITVIGSSEHAEIVCSWTGGRRTKHKLVRSVRRTTQLSRHAELLDRIHVLHADGVCAAAIARTLVAEGWTSAHGKPFTEGSVRSLLIRMGYVSASPKRPSAVVERQAGEFTVSEIAARLNLPEGTIYCWLYKRRLPVRRVKAAWHMVYLLRLNDVEKLLREQTRGGRLPPRSTAPQAAPETSKTL